MPFDDFLGRTDMFPNSGQPYDDGRGHFGDSLASGGDVEREFFRMWGSGDSSTANLPTSLQFSTTAVKTAVTPWFVFRGEDATASTWTPNAGSVTGQAGGGVLNATDNGGTASTLEVDTPCTSSSVEAVRSEAETATSSTWIAATAADYTTGFTSTDDVILEVVIAVVDIDGGDGGVAGTGTSGWGLAFDDTGPYFVRRNGGSTAALTLYTQTEDLEWLHVIAVMHGDDTNFTSASRYYVNGANINNNAQCNDLTGGNTFGILADGHVHGNFAGNGIIAWCAGWKQTAWLGSSLTYNTEMDTWAAQRFAALCGMTATANASTTVYPSTATRAAPAFARKIDATGRQVEHLVGQDWMRRTEVYDKYLNRFNGGLMETAETNYALQSGDISNAAWLVARAAKSGTVSSPIKGYSLYGISIDSVGSDHALYQSTNLVSTGLVDVCLSCYIQGVVGKTDWVLLVSNHVAAPTDQRDRGAFFNIKNGTVGTIGTNVQTAGIEFIADDVYRIWIVMKTTSLNPGNVVVYGVNSDNQNPTACTGDDTVWYYVGHIQITGGGPGKPISWISTTAAAVSRVADDLEFSAVGATPSAGAKTTLHSEVLHPEQGAIAAANSYVFAAKDAAETNTLSQYIDDTTFAASTIKATSSATITAGDVMTGRAQGLTTTTNTALSTLYLDDTSVATDANGYQPGTFTQYHIGQGWDANTAANIPVKNIQVWQGIKTNLAQEVSTPVAYGAFYISASAATSDPDVATKVAGTTTALALSDFTMPADNRLTFTGADTKVFHVNVSFSMTSDENNEVFTFTIAKNGTSDSTSGIERKVGTGADVGAASMDFMLSLATNDYIELFVVRPSGTSSPTVTKMVMTVVEV